MVEVTMRKQNVVETFEANTTFEDLALCAFAAIDHKAKFVVLYDKRRETTFNRRGRGRRA